MWLSLHVSASKFQHLHLCWGGGGLLHTHFAADDLSVTMQLGPLTMAAPLFMEMQLGGLVASPPGPVVGVIGFDVLRR
jgi:hypothetical protein